MWKRMHKTSQNWESGITKSSTCQLILKLRLASPSPSITLQSWSKTALRVTLLSPGVAHLNDLLRQQSENAYLESKNWWILHCFAVFLDFLIFWISDGFEVLWLLILILWLDFLPRAALKSPGHEISSLFKFLRWYGVHVPFQDYAFPCQIFRIWPRN